MSIVARLTYVMRATKRNEANSAVAVVTETRWRAVRLQRADRNPSALHINTNNAHEDRHNS